MEPLDKKYQEQIEEVVADIQKSEELEQYLETEEIEEYRALSNAFEPQIDEIYSEVADNYPLQLMSLEQTLLREDLEGLYLPRLLAFNVLRGVVDNNYKYTFPQDQFGNILLFVAHSDNFDSLSKRIGQSVQMGFALSSDVWISNLLSRIPTKRARSFFQSQRLLKYRNTKERKNGYENLQKQFEDNNFYTTEIPQSNTELQHKYPALRNFLVERILIQKDDTSLTKHLVELLNRDDLELNKAYVYIFGLVANFFDLEEEGNKLLERKLKELSQDDFFVDTYFQFLKELSGSRIPIHPEQDERMYEHMKNAKDSDIKSYYELMHILHENGIRSDETIESVRKFYNSHEGLSDVNANVRAAILRYLKRFFENQPVEDFNEMFEIYQTIIQYIDIFANQEFNQSVKALNLKYLRRLIAHYTDKRGKDYQDIKKFTVSTFTDLGFMTEKELKNFFKTKRKKKKATT